MVIMAGNRAGVCHGDVAAALCDRFSLPEDAFSIHLRPDCEFLVRFQDTVVRARVVERPVHTRCFQLLFHPWSRSADVEPLTLRQRVDIEIRGIPEHGWRRASVERLLEHEQACDSCWSLEDAARHTAGAADETDPAAVRPAALAATGQEVA